MLNGWLDEFDKFSVITLMSQHTDNKRKHALSVDLFCLEHSL